MGVSFRTVATEYICFSGMMPGYDITVEIGIHTLGNVIKSIEIFRPDDYYQSPEFDIYKSYADFSMALEKQFGKPFISVPKDIYGNVIEKWVEPFKITHSITERFVLSEHLIIEL